MSPTSNRLEELATLHNRSPLDLLEWFHERSAIRQYDGGLSRQDADKAALQDIENELEGRA